MKLLILGLTAVLLALANRAAAATPPAPSATNAAAAGTNDLVELEYERLLDMDDEAQAEVDKWILENQEFAAKGGGVPAKELNRRIEKRFEPVRQAYEEFIRKHPNHSKALVAYASFLSDTKDEVAAREQLEKALLLDTNNPAIYNNLANIYGHIGPDVKKAFDFYVRAIDLDPKEPVYLHNLGTTVYLFRKDAREHYGITEQQVFDKALELYSQALRLDPTNFPLASDLAQSYYGIKPTRTEDALTAWTNAFRIARDDIERQGVHLHFARVKMAAGRFDEAEKHLQVQFDPMYTDLRERLVRNLREKREAASLTNAPTAAVDLSNTPRGNTSAKPSPDKP